MIRAEQIPDEVVEAAAKADYEAWRDYVDLRDETLDWGCLEEEEREGKRICARAAIAAALNAWPGANAPEVEKRSLIPTEPTYRMTIIELPCIILPLQQEVSDDA